MGAGRADFAQGKDGGHAVPSAVCKLVLDGQRGGRQAGEVASLKGLAVQHHDVRAALAQIHVPNPQNALRTGMACISSGLLIGLIVQVDQLPHPFLDTAMNLPFQCRYGKGSR